jgi:hypothetical protein
MLMEGGGESGRKEELPSVLRVVMWHVTGVGEYAILGEIWYGSEGL